jgi:hypothetical protein
VQIRNYDDRVWPSLSDYVPALLKYWWTIVPGIVLGLLALVGLFTAIPQLPAWVWLSIFGLGLVIGGFLAFHDQRMRLLATTQQLARVQQSHQTSQAQFEELRRDREGEAKRVEEARHEAVTPMLWATIYGQSMQVGGADIQGYVHLHIEGNGVAFNVAPSFTTGNPDYDAAVAMQLHRGPFGPFKAGTEEKISIRWRLPRQPLMGTFQIAFDNRYDRHFRWIQQVQLMPTDRDPGAAVRIVGTPSTETD